jgi:NAD(P)-dependent dehydrogenase (short-subunit alcohol dehydrogenase family)
VSTAGTGRGVALLTGASRGLGAAAAVMLGAAGFDVAMTARTVTREDVRHWPGSLEETAVAVRSAGRRAVSIRMDLTDLDSVVSAVERAGSELGPIDVFVNNAVYQGSGSTSPLLGTPLEQIEKNLRADLVAPTAMLQAVLPGMVERGHGIVINVTSGAAYREPRGIYGHGGWGFAYGVAKGGSDRMAGLINAELGDRGIVAYNIEPGLVAYGGKLDGARARNPGSEVTPPEAIGAAITWLATSPDAVKFRNERVDGPRLCRDLGLLPGWP